MNNDLHLIEAREVMERYKKLNAETVEKMVPNPNGKGFIMVKTAIDPNAKLFIPKPKERKKTISATKRPSNKNIGSEKKDINVIEKKSKHKRITENLDNSNYSPRNPEVAKNIKDLMSKFVCLKEISTKLNLSYSVVRNYAFRLKKEFPKLRQDANKALSLKALEYVNLFEQGYTITEVAIEKNKTVSTISHFFNKARSKKGVAWYRRVLKAQKNRKNEAFYQSYPEARSKKNKPRKKAGLH